MNDTEDRAEIEQRHRRQEAWKRVRAEAEATLARTRPPEEIEALKAIDAAFLAAVDQAGEGHWRELCQWFLAHPDKPIPPEVARAALRWVVALVPEKPPSGKTVAGLVELCRSQKMGPTESNRHVGMKIKKSEEAVRKDHGRHRRLKR